MPSDLLDVYPLASAAKVIGITHPGLVGIVRRGEVRVVQDLTGKRYLPSSEVKRLCKKYADRKGWCNSGP
jgi:predicted site-specific integrase-resolvase